MITDIIRYIVLSGLLYGGHYFLSYKYPDRGLVENREVVHVFMLVLFLTCHLLVRLISKRFNILLGQVFLGFSVVKLILSGVFMFVLMKVSEEVLSKTFIIITMTSYFSYLLLDVITMLGVINRDVEN